MFSSESLQNTVDVLPLGKGGEDMADSELHLSARDLLMNCCRHSSQETEPKYLC